jgi:hypothetical protein
MDVEALVARLSREVDKTLAEGYHINIYIHILQHFNTNNIQISARSNNNTS